MKMQSGQFARELAGTITRTLPLDERGLLLARVESSFFTIVEKASYINDTLMVSLYPGKYEPIELGHIASQVHLATGLDTGYDSGLDVIMVNLNPQVELRASGDNK